MRTTTRAVSVALLATMTLAACSGGSDDDGAAGAGGGGGGEGGACEPAGEDVTLTYTSWIPGIEDVVAVWNEQNPDIQVEVQTGPNGNGGTYQNFFNQLEAGNPPDLGQIEFDALPNFRVQDGLENLGGCEDVLAAEDQFVDWTWTQVTLGEEGSVYAIPQDTGPMAMFYREDLFTQAGIEVPTTWEEYAAAAEQVRESGGYITNFSTGDINQFAGFVWQAGGSWFQNDGEAWTVELTNEDSTKVADYWQDLIDRDLVSSLPGWTTEWDNAYNTGQAWTWISAVWGANSIMTGAPDTAGAWRVAPMPQWEGEGETAGNWGGSTTAVFKGSENVYEAAKFALWLNTSEEALTLLNEAANLYPATTEGQQLPALQEGVEFYGGQEIYQVFTEAGATVPGDFTWGPTMTQVYNDVSDGFSGAVSGSGTLADALADAQESTVAALEAQAIPVAE
ncbi:ABC transporter substrate-binding protein [Cellulomonas carbonis]|uniref:Sugar ABC transporter substrate-binding protein n=1 Tax=Cellulomonas carbonis T26 TaxID=947969 RepID=A0A0A0BWG1_9CELL|nr:extracellular solute-binding protein [Cellulomonas carbonis]KGM12295.1 sugar ABC transporter substrate-binding protein [Cellulomonas carbonis T26]